MFVVGRQASIQEDGACHSRAYEEGAQQRNAKDLDIVFGDQRLLLMLLFICIRLVPPSIPPSTSTSLYLAAFCKAGTLCKHCVRRRQLRILRHIQFAPPSHCTALSAA